MEKLIFRSRILILVILSVVLIDSCKIDEFKFNELRIKEDWRAELVVPMFYGSMEFRDFITDWYRYNDQIAIDEPQTTLKYNNGSYQVIPTGLIFEPSVVIDSFPLLIQGNYELDSVTLRFDVINTSPYPLNFKLQFYNKLDSLKTGMQVVPEVFDAGIINGSIIEPVKTERYVNLNSPQLQCFNNSNRMRLTSWYSQNGYSKDTLSAHYPIEVSIVLLGEIKGKNEN